MIVRGKCSRSIHGYNMICLIKKRSYHKHIVKHDVVIADKNLYTMNEYFRSTE